MAVAVAIVAAAVAVTVGVYDIMEAQSKARQTQADVGNYGQPTPATPGAGTSPVGTPVATNEAAIAQERYAASQTQIEAEQQQIAQKVGSEQVAETVAEGGITGNAAARGLKMSGSPLMQLIAQKQMGENAIQYTKQQGAAAVKGYQTATQAALDTANLSGQMQIQQAQENVDTAWINAFTNITGAATAIAGEFWKPPTDASASPQEAMPQSDVSDFSYWWT